MKNEQMVAKNLLKYKISGYSILGIIWNAAMSYLLHLILLAVCFLGFIQTCDASVKLFCALMGGMFLGAVLRDVGWLRKGKRQWPLMQRILDWSKVETIANGDGGQPAAGDYRREDEDKSQR